MSLVGDSARSGRAPQELTWPPKRNFAVIAPFTASSRLASSKTCARNGPVEGAIRGRISVPSLVSNNDNFYWGWKRFMIFN